MMMAYWIWNRCNSAIAVLSSDLDSARQTGWIAPLYFGILGDRNLPHQAEGTRIGIAFGNINRIAVVTVYQHAGNDIWQAVIGCLARGRAPLFHATANFHPSKAIGKDFDALDVIDGNLRMQFLRGEYR